MPRLQTFFMALVAIIEQYHEHIKGSSILVLANNTPNGVQLTDEEEVTDLSSLIILSTEMDKKRLSLLNYILHIITLLKPLIAESKYIEDEEISSGIQAQITIFLIDMQQLLQMQAPNERMVAYNDQSVPVCGLINTLMSGGGLCTSGTLIKNALPCLELAPNDINQFIADMFNEHQLMCVRALYSWVININTSLKKELVSKRTENISLQAQLIALRQTVMVTQNNPPSVIRMGLMSTVARGFFPSMLYANPSSRVTELSNAQATQFSDNETDSGSEGENESEQVSFCPASLFCKKKL